MICTADLPLVSGLYEWDGTAWRDAPNAVMNLIARSRVHFAPTPPGQLRPDGNLAIGPEVPIGNTGLVMQEIVPPGAVTRADIQKVFDEQVRDAPVRLTPTEAEVTMGTPSTLETMRRRDAAFAKVIGDMQAAVSDKQRLVNTILFPADGTAIVFSGTTYRFNATVNYWQSTVAGHAGITRDGLWRWYEENNEAVQLAERTGESDE
jgi:hypothetical protein